MKTVLSAESLNSLGDGYAGRAVDAALGVINQDLIDRGHDGKPRTLTVTYTFTPKGKHLKIDVKTATKCPAYQPPETIAKYDGAAGGFVFNPDAADNPDQQQFPEMSRDAKE